VPVAQSSPQPHDHRTRAVDISARPRLVAC
jgi:hypothetical protein